MRSPGTTVAQRIAAVLAAGFLVVLAWAALLPAHSHGASCGIWAAPKLTDESTIALVKQSGAIVDQSSALGLNTDDVQATTLALIDATKSCDSKLATRKTVTWVALGGVIVGPLGALFIAGELGTTYRRREPAET